MDEQTLNARRELEQRKKEREEERERKKNSYGIINRKEELSMERLRKNKLRCTCGALERGTIHTEDCPVVREARSRLR